MEEKERYEFGQRTLFNNREELTTFDGFNLDDFMQIICKLLNQQDKRIKGLEETNKELEIKLDKCGTELVNAENLVSYLENENQQLKQQLHDLPKNIVEEIRIAIFEGCREYFNAEDDGVIQYTEITPKKCNKILDAILKKYGGEDE